MYRINIKHKSRETVLSLKEILETIIENVNLVLSSGINNKDWESSV